MANSVPPPSVCRTSSEVAVSAMTSRPTDTRAVHPRGEPQPLIPDVDAEEAVRLARLELDLAGLIRCTVRVHDRVGHSLAYA
jgi:hypothetical protein